MNSSNSPPTFTFFSERLASELNEDGFWTGELSSSALATAVAIVALKLSDEEKSLDQIDRGISWLRANINENGGFGDSPGSLGNVSTTLLCYAALRFCADDRSNSMPSRPNTAAPPDLTTILSRMERYLVSEGVDVKSTGVVASILGYYGKDYTFSVPILSMLVICRVLDPKALDMIPQLPFELAILPSSLYRFFNLQVVSYAIPALVAVGIYLFRHKHRFAAVAPFIRKRAIGPALRKLLVMMPESGGFLEAIPLTAFVSMCLIESGFGDHQVVVSGTMFLKKLQRPDGSWPIDTDLSTWVTTLGIKALGNHLPSILKEEQRDKLRSYLIDNQYQRPHLFNNARAGGWGWTSFSGSVPDADDTAGAILALLALGQDENDTSVKLAVMKGCGWLAHVQNRDGGIPTFCKGWGRLPFDQSCADLTGHALLAWIKTIERYRDKFQGKELKILKKHIIRSIMFLSKAQYPDGSWLPLWFGNQLAPKKTNPVYGTARVMVYLQDALVSNDLDKTLQKLIAPMVQSAGRYLVKQQNDDGSWGAEKGIQGSIEETALAISALAATGPGMCEKGLAWLDGEYQAHGLRAKPIGLYFATLWYHEKMYPLVFYVEALRRMLD